MTLVMRVSDLYTAIKLPIVAYARPSQGPGLTPRPGQIGAPGGSHAPVSGPARPIGYPEGCGPWLWFRVLTATGMRGDQTKQRLAASVDVAIRACKPCELGLCCCTRAIKPAYLRGGKGISINKIILALLIAISLQPMNSRNSIAAERIAIEVDSIGNDMIGQRLVYEVKEVLQRSIRYDINSRYYPRFKLKISTIDPDSNYARANEVCIYHVTLLRLIKIDNGDILPLYLTGILSGFGVRRIADAANKIVASTDRDISGYLK